MDATVNEAIVLEAICLECRGPLSEQRQDGIVDYHCLVGHRYSVVTLLNVYSEAQEKALWSVVVALEESVNLVRAVAPYFPDDVREQLKKQAETKQHQAIEIRAVIERLETFKTG